MKSSCDTVVLAGTVNMHYAIWAITKMYWLCINQNASSFYLGESYFSWESKFSYTKSKSKSNFTVFKPPKYSSESNKIAAWTAI